MSNIDKHAQGEKTREAFERWAEQSGALPWGILKKHRNQDGTYPGPHYTYMWHAWNACHEALLDELEAAESGFPPLTVERLMREKESLEERVAELEAKLAKPVQLPKTNGYWTEQERAFEEAITLAKRQVRLAGFRCEGDE
ncbi:hypothetical protein ACSIFE_001687 [Enterobacter hormaechei]